MNVISTTARHLLRACAVLITTLPMGASALAQPGDFDQIVAFGDSLMDSGNHSPSYDDGELLPQLL